MRILYLTLLSSILLGCGVGKPILAVKRPAVEKTIKSSKHPLPFSVGVAPASLPKKPKITHKHSSLPQIPPDRLQAAFLSTSKSLPVFKKTVSLKPKKKSLFESAKKAGVDLLLVPKFNEAEVYYAGTTGWYVPNLFIWFILDAASWFIADEKYGLTLKGNLQIYSVKTGKLLFTIPLNANVEAELNDFQRGWKFWGILFVPKKLSSSNWTKITNTLLPHLEEEIKAQFIKGVLTSFSSFTKTEKFAKLYNPPKKKPPKPTTKPDTTTIKPKPLRILTKKLPSAEEKKSYSIQLNATGGRPPYKWVVKGLPKGLSCDEKKGLIVGFPDVGTGDKEYKVKIGLSDKSGAKAEVQLPLYVKAKKPPKPKKPRLAAVIVGIEDYKEANVVRAAFALRDAREVAKLLSSLKAYEKESVVLIEGAKATKAVIEKEIKKIKSCDLFVFFFAGNGATGFQKEAPHYLLLHDTKTPDLKNGLKLSELIEICRNVKAKQRLLLIDAGFNMSGEGRTITVTEVKPKLQDFPSLKADDLVVLLACSGKQTAFASSLSRIRHGFFSYFLLKALAGGADTNKDGKITEKELFLYLHSRVKEESSENQIPVKLGKGKVVLLLK